MRSTCIRCGPRAITPARSTPPTGCAGSGQLSLWIAGGLLLLFVIFYAIFLMVLISQGGDWGHHHRYMD